MYQVVKRNDKVVDFDITKISTAIKKAFDAKRANKPCFVRVSVGNEEDVLPFVPGGKANIDSIRD